MKRLLSALAIVVATVAEAAPRLGDPIWETSGLRTPESALVYEMNGKKVLLVSEIEGDAFEADGAGGIALLSIDGEVLEKDFVRGLNAPKGMAVYENRLYVADIDVLVAIDLRTRKVVARYPIAGAVLLNDVAADSKGVIFVSDTRTGEVFRLIEGKIEKYLQGLEGANGLYVDGNDLLIGAGSRLMRARNGELSEVASGFAAGVDGIERLADGGWILTCWVGLIYHLSAAGDITLLLDSRDPQMNTADIGYDKDTNILYVPTFLSNSVRAYAL